jgi:hypothetical protein
MPGDTASPYELGTTITIMPTPPVDDHCIAVTAGPLTFVIESRQLTDEIARTALREDQIADNDGRPGPSLDDYGACLHVHGTADGLEYLRFDCFEHEPHYHYVRYADGGSNQYVRIDQNAEGDPIEWTLGRLRERLPEMLEYVDMPDLASQLRAERASITAVVDELAHLLRRARAQATVEHGRAPDAAEAGT